VSASANWSVVDTHPRVSIRLDTDDLLASVADPARGCLVERGTFGGDPELSYAAASFFES